MKPPQLNTVDAIKCHEAIEYISADGLEWSGGRMVITRGKTKKLGNKCVPGPINPP
jgi:hypothetical protein